MRAEYEKEADLLVIELERATEPTKGESIPAGPIIEYLGGRPVAIEVLSAASGLSNKLNSVAGHLELDLDTLLRIANLAIDNPDTLVSLDLQVRTGQHLH